MGTINSYYFRSFFLYLLSIVCLVSAQSKTTIHIVHPWVDDQERSVNPPWIISSETGWYPGLPMQAEGGDWYTYTFTKLNRTTNDRVEFASYIPDEYNEYGQPEQYPSGQQLILLDIFGDAPPTSNEVWIEPSTSGGNPTIRFQPPSGGKVIAVLNRWELGAPRITVNNLGIVSMRPLRSPDRCRWFLYNYYGTTDTVCALFINSLDNSHFGLEGTGSSSCIDITTLLSKSDTAWIYLASLNDTIVTTSSTFPGIIGECSKTITLAALMRDIGLHPDFGTYTDLESENCGGWQTGMVENKLGSDGKPVKKAHRCEMIHSRFDWFTTQTFSNGYTNETCYDLTLSTNEEGLYVYDTNAFFPLDSFVYLDAERTVLNPNNNLFIESTNKPPANVHFTMELSAQFEYHQGQTFYFRGDDDVWVFIDSQLVVDLGGNHGPIEGSVNLDDLGLEQGTTYSFKLFFTERNCCGSNFLMQTSLNLKTESRLFAVMSIPSPGQIQFTFFERVSRSSLACDASVTDVDTVDAEAQFFIEGPQFTEGITELPSGLLYGGIYIANNKNIIIVDTSAMTGLAPGNYIVTSYLQSDPSQSAKVLFTIVKPPKPDIVKNPITAAAFFADNGNGSVNRAEIYYTYPLSRLPDSLVLYWPEPLQDSRRLIVTPSINGEVVLDNANGTHLTVTIAEPFDSLITKNRGTSRLGTSYIYDTTFSKPEDIARFDINDSIGPLLMSALYLERRDDGIDTFYLTFSEDVEVSLLVGKSLNLITADGTESIVDIVASSRRLDTVIAVAKQLPLQPVIGDHMRIYPEGPLTDRYGNKAHPLNRPVPVLIRKAPPEVIDAYYIDFNADGIIDRSIFNFDRPASLRDCSFSLSWTTGTIVSASPESTLYYLKSDSTQLGMYIDKASVSTLSVATSGMMGYQLTLNGVSASVQDGIVADSAAPVIIAASYRPALFSTESATYIPDTMLVEFSELIGEQIPKNPITLKKQHASFSFSPALTLLKHNGTSLVFIVDSLVPDQLYPSDDDSVFINVEAPLSDETRVFQNNPDNRRVLLDFSESPSRFRVTWGPNPFDPKTEDGFIFIIDPYIKSRGSVNYTVDLTIYDKTGSIVFTKPWPPGKPAVSVKEILSWNGTNKRGRYVGNGTYLALLKIVDSKGNRIQPVNKKPIFIGIYKKN